MGGGGGVGFRPTPGGKICLALPKFSTKFVSARFSICQVWAHWDTAKYLLTTSFNRTEINTIACSLFAGKVTWDLRSHELTVIFNRFDRICCLGILLLVFQFFFFLEFFWLQQKQLLLLLCQWRLHLVLLQRSVSGNNFSELRTWMLRLKIEIKKGGS